MIVRRSTVELEKLRKSGLLVYQILQDLKPMVVEGATTQDLEVVAEKMIADAGAKPAFKGYYSQASGTKYPFVLCTSVNEEVVHGMPSAKRKLKSGDIVSIDTGVQLNGYFRGFGGDRRRGRSERFGQTPVEGDRREFGTGD